MLAIDHHFQRWSFILFLAFFPSVTLQFHPTKINFPMKVGNYEAVVWQFLIKIKWKTKGQCWKKVVNGWNSAKGSFWQHFCIKRLFLTTLFLQDIFSQKWVFTRIIFLSKFPFYNILVVYISYFFVFNISIFCFSAGGQLYMWGKMKNTGDDWMYPKPCMDLRYSVHYFVGFTFTFMFENRIRTIFAVTLLYTVSKLLMFAL